MFTVANGIAPHCQDATQDPSNIAGQIRLLELMTNTKQMSKVRPALILKLGRLRNDMLKLSSRATSSATILVASSSSEEEEEEDDDDDDDRRRRRRPKQTITTTSAVAPEILRMNVTTALKRRVQIPYTGPSGGFASNVRLSRALDDQNDENSNTRRQHAQIFNLTAPHKQMTVMEVLYQSQ